MKQHAASLINLADYPIQRPCPERDAILAGAELEHLAAHLHGCKRVHEVL